MQPYTKSLQDELDWKLLDQLYGAVIQISNFCFEIKKFCVTTLFIVMTFVVKFTSDRLDNSIFATGLFISICFWFLDSMGYFYQVKLRGMMESIRHRLALRNGEKLESANGVVVIEMSRTFIPIYNRIFDAVFNSSMWLYVLLILLDLGVWLLFISGRIQ